MSRLPIPATKSHLIRLRADLGFLRAGRDLLDQKREFLTEALQTFEREARAVRARVEDALGQVYDDLAEALAAHGEAGLERLTLAAVPLPPLDLRERSLMGVAVPVVQAPAEGGEGGAASRSGLRGGTGDAGPAADAVSSALRALVPSLLELAELESSCLRLARELASVRRKLNALERVHIPAHADTIRFIADQLEEREREQLFQLKRIRALAQEERA
jgi:V/A-type H+-transporting ATPase subunit D